jgi:hypothetical protein
MVFLDTVPQPGFKAYSINVCRIVSLRDHGEGVMVLVAGDAEPYYSHETKAQLLARIKKEFT